MIVTRLDVTARRVWPLPFAVARLVGVIALGFGVYEAVAFWHVLVVAGGAHPIRELVVSGLLGVPSLALGVICLTFRDVRGWWYE